MSNRSSNKTRDEGKKAFYAGDSLNDNPYTSYPPGSGDKGLPWDDWREGWLSARRRALNWDDRSPAHYRAGAL